MKAASINEAAPAAPLSGTDLICMHLAAASRVSGTTMSAESQLRNETTRRTT